MIRELLRFLPFALGAYAAGCFSAGYYLVRLLSGKDLRSTNSGSTGARNAGRELGRGGFAAVFAIDALKGAGIIWLARYLDPEPRLSALLVPLVVAGHIWPAQLGFRGGKGLVTALGAMIGMDWRFLPAGLLLYFAPHLTARIFAALRAEGPHPALPTATVPVPARPASRAAQLLSGILPMAVMPFLPFPAFSPVQVLSLCVSSACVLWAHRAHATPTVTSE